MHGIQHKKLPHRDWRLDALNEVIVVVPAQLDALLHPVVLDALQGHQLGLAALALGGGQLEGGEVGEGVVEDGRGVAGERWRLVVHCFFLQLHISLESTHKRIIQEEMLFLFG